MKATGIGLSILILTVAGTAIGAGPTSDDLYNAIRANDLARLRSLVHDSADANTKDGRGETALMYAAVVGSLDAMKFLIAKGAAVNTQNEFGSTALIWSATDLAKVRLLLAHGANVNVASKRGRTALFLAAMTDRSADTVRLLLAKGADPKVMDAFKNSTLMAAAAGNDIETIRLIIDTGVDVNAANALGMTPLIVSAGNNGNTRAVQMLLAKGAKVNAVALAPFLYPGVAPKAGVPQLGSVTALGQAAPFGPPELVKALLDAGADVNVRDVRDMTPLMLAVGTDHQDPAIIQMLLDHGAKLEPQSILHETAHDWARKIGLPSGIQLLKAKTEETPRAVPVALVAPMEPRAAVERSVALLERTTHQFFANSGCAACHSQGITDLAAGEARSKGVSVDDGAARERVQMVKVQYAAEALYERMDLLIPEITGYSTAGLAAMGYAPDKMTDAMASAIAAQQLANGSWHVVGFPRAPAEEGDIFRTALSVRALKIYGPPGRAAELHARVSKAKQWLMSAKALNAEDRNMQMLGLHWAGADARELARFTKVILALQQSDGGWRQRDELTTDAYATGESLYTLAVAGGVAPGDMAYQKGVKFLLSTEAEDGSWHVVSRAVKFQVYFESGFPYGGDQWISAWATGWASMALAQAIEAPVTRASR
ncbi:MAG TPA: ankyrin repeat domain-containing protein [Bryobacteraceae bacterium]|nr:ankyrin repeat domain-containing protein [Bryobacteraceae bacterium]